MRVLTEAGPRPDGPMTTDVVFLLPTACESRQDSAPNLTGPNGSNSISMSVEINGIMYTGRTRWALSTVSC